MDGQTQPPAGTARIRLRPDGTRDLDISGTRARRHGHLDSRGHRSFGAEPAQFLFRVVFDENGDEVTNWAFSQRTVRAVHSALDFISVQCGELLA